MSGLMSWMRSVLGSTVDDIFCVSCRERRTVDRIDIVEGNNTRGGFRRLVGRCRTCGAATSSFLS
jgi:hypothetical protein